MDYGKWEFWVDYGFGSWIMLGPDLDFVRTGIILEEPGRTWKNLDVLYSLFAECMFLLQKCDTWEYGSAKRDYKNGDYAKWDLFSWI